MLVALPEGTKLRHSSLNALFVLTALPVELVLSVICLGAAHWAGAPAARMLSAGACDKRREGVAPDGLRKESTMKLASTRLIARDVKAVVSFYERVTGQPADWLAPVFAEIVTPGATLAVGGEETVAAFKEGVAEAGKNRTAILEFMVEDVDAEFSRLEGAVEVVHEPKLMPWGNRTAQFRDPEGTLVALYTPVTEAAKQRFAGR